jgi:ligand-binding sensor domain-containing protein
MKICFLFLLFLTHFFAEALPSDTASVTAVSGKYEWRGTAHGLLRIHIKKKKQVVYTTANSIFPSDSITCICCRSNGDVWIGTPKGIVRFDSFAFLLITTDNSELPENSIISITEDALGDLRIITLHNNLAEVRGNTLIKPKKTSKTP